MALPFPARRGILLVAAVVCPGCLIFDPTDFPDPKNELPAILWTDPPSGDVQFVDRTSIEPVVFRLRVYDGNEDDTLDARAFLDPTISEARQGTITIETDPQGDPRERTVEVQLERGIITRGCHVVEVDVVDRTPWPGPREVAAGGGRATETWFVLAHDGDGTEDISLSSCPGADSGGDSP